MTKAMDYISKITKPDRILLEFGNDTIYDEDKKHWRVTIDGIKVPSSIYYGFDSPEYIEAEVLINLEDTEFFVKNFGLEMEKGTEYVNVWGKSKEFTAKQLDNIGVSVRELDWSEIADYFTIPENINLTKKKFIKLLENEGVDFDEADHKSYKDRVKTEGKIADYRKRITKIINSWTNIDDLKKICGDVEAIDNQLKKDE